MGSRLCQAAVLLFWLLSMSWLAVAKVLPPLLGGNPPNYRAELELRDKDAKPVCWKLRWNGRTIGFAASKVIRHAGGEAEMRSVVKFEDLPWQSMIGELLGPLAVVGKPMFQGGGDFELNMLIATQMRFDPRQQLTGFQTTVDLADMTGFLQIEGRIDSHRKLQLVARLSDPAPAIGSHRQWQVFRNEIELPKEALVDNALSLRRQLNNLSVGQSWTMPVYRSFPPNSPVQIVEAQVERHEVIFWEGKDVETLVVVYRSDAGSGIQATRDPIGKEWVRPDGTVLQQEVTFSGLRITLERLPETTLDPRRKLLDKT